jgi:hypothetical protein
MNTHRYAYTETPDSQGEHTMDPDGRKCNSNIPELGPPSYEYLEVIMNSGALFEIVS